MDQLVNFSKNYWNVCQMEFKKLKVNFWNLSVIRWVRRWQETEILLLTRLSLLFEFLIKSCNQINNKRRERGCNGLKVPTLSSWRQEWRISLSTGDFVNFLTFSLNLLGIQWNFSEIDWSQIKIKSKVYAEWQPIRKAALRIEMVDGMASAAALLAHLTLKIASVTFQPDARPRTSVKQISSEIWMI